LEFSLQKAFELSRQPAPQILHGGQLAALNHFAPPDHMAAAEPFWLPTMPLLSSIANGLTAGLGLRPELPSR